MANRSRAYYRKMRVKHIHRKKKIAELYYGWGYYRIDGKYSKGKIHCSCPMCSEKTKNKKNHYYPSRNWKHSDKVKIEKMNSQLKDLD